MGGKGTRRTVCRTAAAALLALAVGCAGAPAGPGAASRSPSAASRSPGADGRGPSAHAGRQIWSVGLTKHEASGTCLATARLMVCSVAPAGVVARSAVTGEQLWSVAADQSTGRNAGLAVDGNRAVSAGGRTIRAADLTTGKSAWTRTLPAGRTFGAPAATDGVVYAATYGATAAEAQTLFAYRASDGAQLWQRTSTDIGPVAVGGRVYTVEPGNRAVARDARTGTVVATSDPAHPCPSLIIGPHDLVCAESPAAAGDTAPPVTLVDPVTLKVVRTLWRPVPGTMPHGGMISRTGVLVLRAVNAEDQFEGEWIAIDIRTSRMLWGTDNTDDIGDEAVVVGSRVVWVSGGRLVSVDLRRGPDATGAEAPRRSPDYSEAHQGRYPRLTAHGTHIILQPIVRPTLRSVAAP
jgi:outer membrane protein assembly factor BamB